MNQTQTTATGYHPLGESLAAGARVLQRTQCGLMGSKPSPGLQGDDVATCWRPSAPTSDQLSKIIAAVFFQAGRASIRSSHARTRGYAEKSNPASASRDRCGA